MPRGQVRPLRYRDFVARLRDFGVEVIDLKRGKGSHVILLQPEAPGSTRGPQYPLRHHGDGDEIPVGTVRACLRRFSIAPEDFFPD